ncbi:MAG: hypothetical protein KHZ15_14225 [Coprobacillus cateniformis]|uniref:hypothetical protein n=1 Tax=Longibaculum muris TaxID=1796628 RepID=UPI003AB3A298|nr:hypothetical protein [Coprobacillus cateniformis]
MKIIKPLITILGFLSALYYTPIFLIFLFNHIPIISLIPTMIITICTFLAPIYLMKKNHQKWIGIIAAGFICICLFIEAASSYAFSSVSSAGYAIILSTIYLLYYFVLQKY